MKKYGSLIWITGYFGAGKSTLAKEAVKTIPEIDFIKVLTIRPPRPDEKNLSTNEYLFIDKVKYEAIRSTSKSWHHMIFGNNCFGTDANTTNELIKIRKNFVRVVIPDTNILNEMKSLYIVPPKIIWIDTSLEISNSRIKGLRPERLEHPLQNPATREQITQFADFIFKPSGDLKKDHPAFQSLIKKIISENGFHFVPNSSPV